MPRASASSACARPDGNRCCSRPSRDDIAGAVVLYGAIGGREWQGNELRPTPIEDSIAQVNCPVFGHFRRSGSYYFRRLRRAIPQLLGEIQEELSYAPLSPTHPTAGLTTPCRAATARRPPTMLGADDGVSEEMLRRRLGPRSVFSALTKATIRANYDFSARTFAWNSERLDGHECKRNQFIVGRRLLAIFTLVIQLPLVARDQCGSES